MACLGCPPARGRQDCSHHRRLFCELFRRRFVERHIHTAHSVGQDLQISVLVALQVGQDSLDNFLLQIHLLCCGLALKQSVNVFQPGIAIGTRSHFRRLTKHLEQQRFHPLCIRAVRMRKGVELQKDILVQKQHTSRLLPVAPGPPNLLDVLLKAPWHGCMQDSVHLGVDAHSESHCCTNDSNAPTAELRLYARPLLGIDARVVSNCCYPRDKQGLCRLFSMPLEGAVHDAPRAAQRGVEQSGDEPAARCAVEPSGGAQHAQPQVVPQRCLSNNLILRNAKDVTHGLLCLACGSGCEAEDGTVPQAAVVLQHVAQPEERWAEIVAPLCHAVHLIHTHETERRQF
mmetsp:Transcript_1574/g.4554  ORF Transcript_1574/g.4554 Transcript_1574/m.4554 type:complete len:344 (+) Transcript_1574:959-1990(+)